MVKARKRRPGGGRKPKGAIRGKNEWFSTRITSETRRAIEQEAAASGKSISQVAERLLVFGLQEKKWRDDHKALRALCFVIERIALSIAGGRWLDPTDPAFKESALFNEWRTDPFHYRAFKLAVASLLTALEPKGEIRSPYAAEAIDAIDADDPPMKELMKRTYESPENYAAYIFSNIWRELNRSYPLSEREKDFMRFAPVGAIMLADFYQMYDAQHDLGLDIREVQP